jgi:hypothetical protein
VSVTRRDGTRSIERIARIVWRGSDVVLAAIG